MDQRVSMSVDQHKTIGRLVQSHGQEVVSIEVWQWGPNLRIALHRAHLASVRHEINRTGGLV